jgi:hypothetical protein
MAFADQLRESWQQSLEKLREQQFYQQIKQQWDELDPQSRLLLKSASIVGVVLGVLIAVFSSILSVRSLKGELAEKLELTSYVESETETLRRLKETNASINAGSPPGGPWNAYVQGLVSAAGIDAASATLGQEKPGTSSAISDEALMEVSLKKVSIKQVVRLALQIETGARPAKVKNISIETNADPAGYMDAKLALSLFNVKEEGAAK